MSGTCMWASLHICPNPTLGILMHNPTPRLQTPPTSLPDTATDGFPFLSPTTPTCTPQSPFSPPRLLLLRLPLDLLSPTSYLSPKLLHCYSFSLCCSEALLKYQALSSTTRKIPYTNVRALSNWLHQPVTQVGLRWPLPLPLTQHDVVACQTLIILLHSYALYFPATASLRLHSCALSNCRPARACLLTHTFLVFADVC